MFSILRPLLFGLDPETAHDLAIKSLKFNPLPSKIFKVEDEKILEIQLLGKNFPNPIGLAAGFDKSAEAYNSLLKLGFGFVEVGTVTPLKQFGNPKPRIFRLEDDQALINRLGFNNDGAKVVRNRIKRKLKSAVQKISKETGLIDLSYTYVIFGKNNVYKDKFTLVFNELNKTFRKIKQIKN